jgi:hypothetical protein
MMIIIVIFEYLLDSYIFIVYEKIDYRLHQNPDKIILKRHQKKLNLQPELKKLSSMYALPLS